MIENVHTVTETAEDMRARFEEGIRKLLANKRCDNKAYLSKDEYRTRLADVKAAQKALQTKGVEKNVKHYRLVRKYNIITIDGEERLIKVDQKSGNILLYVTNEELFDILHESHQAIGHGGRNRMRNELQTKYSNITKETIMVYLRLCVQCQEKSAYRKKGGGVDRSIPESHSFSQPDLNQSRARLDFIDMRTRAHNGYNYIMVYEDQATKFVVLKSLKSKRVEECACNLLEIYATFGAPIVLDSSAGTEFVDPLIGELHKMWDGVKVVRGTSALYRGQNSTDIEAMLVAWMEDKKSEDWPLGLKCIQFQMNCTARIGMNCTPYEVMFGYPARVGLLTAGIPDEILENVHEEDDLAIVFGNAEEDAISEDFADDDLECIAPKTVSDVELLPVNEKNNERFHPIQGAHKRSIQMSSERAIKCIKSEGDIYE